VSDRFDAIPKVEEATWLGDEERRGLRALARAGDRDDRER